MPTELIVVEGLAKLRRDLRAAAGPEVVKEVRDELKAAVGDVLEASRPLTPAGTEPHKGPRLRDRSKVGTSGAKVLLRNPAPYANVIHWGGNVPNAQSQSTRTKVHFEGRPFFQEAAEAGADKALEQMADGIERVLERHGFN